MGSGIGVDLSGAIGLDSVESNLGALSAARPQIRFRVLSEVETRELGVALCLPQSEGYWTSADGLDCIDSAIANIALAYWCNTPPLCARLSR